MTDSFACQNCPKCGKENLAHMTHCVHCGAELEDLFTFEGQIEIPEGDFTDDTLLTLPFMLDDLSAPAKDETAEKAKSQDPTTEQAVPEDTDWLERVRQRARIEEDASGELTKGINSMQESIEEKNSDAESQYQAWLDEVRENAEREKAKWAERLQPSPVDEDGVPEWLRRIRALHPSNSEEEDQGDTGEEWTEEALEELRRRELGDDYVPPEEAPEDVISQDEADADDAEEETQEVLIEHNIPEDDDLNPLDNLTPSEEPLVDADSDLQDAIEDGTDFVIVGDPKLNPNEVFVTPGLDGELRPEGVKPGRKRRDDKTEEEKEAMLQDLVILRGQHEKVALLKSLISDEGKLPISSTEPKKKKSDHSRLIIGLAFIIVLLLSILFLPKTIGEQPNQSVPQMWFGHHLNSLEKTDKVLVIMSYYSASAPELEALAAPVLAQFEEKGLDWHVVTLRMDGLWQIQSLYDKAGIKNPNQHAFLPGGQFAMLDLAVKPDGVAGLGMQNPLPEYAPNLKDFDMVLFISDSALSLRGWLEQAAPNTADFLTLAILSQKEAASLQPYFDSNQILGYLSGMRGLNGTVPHSGNDYRAYQAGLILLLLILIVGLVLAFRKPKSPIAKQEERQ